MYNKTRLMNNVDFPIITALVASELMLCSDFG